MSGKRASFAGVDWGTSRLRIWIMDDDGRVLAERRSERGMATVAAGGFAHVLEQELAALDAPPSLPAVICGMAGARQGWREVPYLDLPARLDNLAKGALVIDGAARPVYILPGLAQSSPEAADVMRGEETQIAGAASVAATTAETFCLPGTHSKWATVSDGAVTGFSTFLTGEMFALLCEHSILRHSVGSNRQVAADNPVFLDRLRDTLASPDVLLSRLFSIRAAGLLAGLSQTDAAAALSGHLIGAEIAAAQARWAGDGSTVVLVASGAIVALYEAAMNVADLRYRLVDAETAVRAGLLDAARTLLTPKG